MSKWPDNFDFETDETCQEIFKPFIEEQIELLGEYDAKRPAGHVYEFHLHSERVAQDVKKACLHMGLGEKIANNMYWAVLAHDIGKRTLPIDIWDTEGKPDAALKSYRRTHTSTGKEIVETELGLENHPFKDLMLDIMMNHHEKMDGTGHFKIPGEKLSNAVRLTCIADSYDGWRIKRPHYEAKRDTSPAGVMKRIREEKGPEFFDMTLVDQFEDMKKNDHEGI